MAMSEPTGASRYPQVPAQPRYPSLEEEILAFWREDRTFEASVEHVPAGLLTNEGLRRHYKIFGIITAVDGDLSKTPDAKAA